jgi:hypothetical protein
MQNTAQQTTNVFGKEVKVKILTIGEVFELQKKDMTDINTIVEVVSNATGISEDEIKNAPAEYLDDINVVLDIALGNSKKK